MALDLVHKEQLMFPLGQGHGMQFFLESPEPQPPRVKGGVLILVHVTEFQASREIHWKEPPGDVAEEADCPADGSDQDF
jgi:hypothetical protein